MISNNVIDTHPRGISRIELSLILHSVTGALAAPPPLQSRRAHLSGVPVGLVAVAQGLGGAEHRKQQSAPHPGWSAGLRLAAAAPSTLSLARTDTPSVI